MRKVNTPGIQSAIPRVVIVLMRVDEGRKGVTLIEVRMRRAQSRTYEYQWEGRGKGLLCAPGSESQLRGEWETSEVKESEKNKWGWTC